MTNRRDFLRGLLSSIGGIMIVKTPSINDVIKEPGPTPSKQPQQMFFSGSSCAIRSPFFTDPSKTREPEDGYVGSYVYPYSDDVPMADSRKIDGYVELSEEEFAETKKIIEEDNLMSWVNVKRGKKPLRWWYHKILCEFWYSVGKDRLYYKHLNIMCDKY